MKRILVVDDLEGVRRTYQRILRREGYEVDEAEDGRMAQQKLGGCDYDLLITDYNMPMMNGIDLCRWVRQNETLKGLPIIMIAAISSEEKESTEGLVDKFLRKPLDLEELIISVKSLSGGKENE